MKEIEEWSSVKNYSNKEVEVETLEKIFEQVVNAPTAFNLQPYRFLVLDGEEEKQKAVESVVSGNEWIGEADKIVVLVGFDDFDRNSGKAIDDMIKRSELDLSGAEELRARFKDYNTRDEAFKTGWLTRNTFIPATFFMLACRSEGIGSCPVRGFKQDNLKKKLDLESSDKPMLLIPIGYPENEEPRHWRRNPEDIFEIK